MNWYKEAQRAGKKTQPLDNRVFQIAKTVRDQEIEDDEDGLKARCLPISRKLRSELIKNGYDAYVVRGLFYLDDPNPEYDPYDLDPPDKTMKEQEELEELHDVLHYWVELSGNIIDITATQFNDEIDEEMPEVVYGPYSSFPRYTYQTIWDLE